MQEGSSQRSPRVVSETLSETQNLSEPLGPVAPIPVAPLSPRLGGKHLKRATTNVKDGFVSLKTCSCFLLPQCRSRKESEICAQVRRPHSNSYGEKHPLRIV